MLTRLLTDLDDDTTLTSFDGVGAYNDVYRTSFFAKLANDPGLAPILPFVKLWYSAPSVYTWIDASGTVHQVHKSETTDWCTW